MPIKQKFCVPWNINYFLGKIKTFFFPILTSIQIRNFPHINKYTNKKLTFGELRRVAAVTRTIPCVLSYTGGFHSASTAYLKKNQH